MGRWLDALPDALQQRHQGLAEQLVTQQAEQLVEQQAYPPLPTLLRAQILGLIADSLPTSRLTM